jgi:hypothetical protein
MNRRTLLAVVFFVPLGGACFQNIDSSASSGRAPASAVNVAEMTPWQLCQSPSCDEIDGAVPVLLDTPPIYLADGSTTTSPCDDVEAESMTIRQTYCAACHEAPASQASLGFILNDAQLATALSQTAVLPDGGPQRLLAPGSPYSSWLYQSVALGLSGSSSGMPPTAQPGYPVIPRPSAAELSVLYGWIVACVPGPDGGGGAYVNGGGSYGPGAGVDDDGGASAGAAGDAGEVGDAGEPTDAGEVGDGEAG